MRREFIIIAAVLVPFALLVAAGFHFSPAVVVVTEPPHPDPLPLRGEGTPPPRSVPVIDSGRPPEFPPELTAPLSAVLPEVRRCFVDLRLKTRHQVKVRFTPTREGGFAQVQVVEQNPYLAACLEDVFSEVGWHPAGKETFSPAEHTFSFDPLPD